MPQGQSRAEEKVLRRSFGVTLVVAAAGVLFGLLSGSLSIVFDGVFSLIDATMSLLALFVARLLARGDSRRFQHGFWHIEPMVLVFNGFVLMLTCAYAFLNAVGSLLQGGRDLAFGWAVGYATAIAAVSFAMAAYGRRANRRIGSDLVALDVQGWIMAGTITGALLLAFLAGLLLGRGPYAHLTPYADPLALAVLTLCLLPVPVRTVRKAMSEVLLVTPTSLDRRVRAILDEVTARHGFPAYSSYVAKIGRGLFVEAHILVPPCHPLDGVQGFDAVREEISAALGSDGPHRWLTVDFVGDRRWF